MTSITSGKGKLVFGDSEGGITLCDEEFALQRFNAYEQSVNFAYQVSICIFPYYIVQIF